MAPVSSTGCTRRPSPDAARRPVERAECRLTFQTARLGLRTLLSCRATGRLVEDMNHGGTRIDGNRVLMLGFHALTRIVTSIGSTRRLRHAASVSVRAPESRRGRVQAADWTSRSLMRSVSRVGSVVSIVRTRALRFGVT
jgi:hypothetical protein